MELTDERFDEMYNDGKLIGWKLVLLPEEKAELAKNQEIVERLKKRIKLLEAWEPPRDSLEEFKKILKGSN